MIETDKIPIRNIYHMLCYAFSFLRQSDSRYVDVEECENAQNMYAAVLCGGFCLQIKRGLYREYLGCREDLPVLRGRIDMPGTIRNLAAHRQVLTCQYDELSENNLPNRILKTTMQLLSRSDQVAKKYRDSLHRELLYFSGVDSVDPARVRWSEIRFHRNNQTYRILIDICWLVLRDMLQTEDQGKYRLASFKDDQRMYYLYEKFILEYYRQNFPELTVASSQISWALDDDEGTMLPKMQSDIMLSKAGRVLIIDAKYYSRITLPHYDARTVRSAHLYQIFAYVKNKAAEPAPKYDEVSGMLLYARTDEDVQPDQRYRMSGNRIDVRTLDLSRESAEIDKQLDGIAEEFFGAAGA